MKKIIFFVLVTSLASLILSVPAYAKTPGEKLDKTLDKVKDTYQISKEKVNDLYEDAKGKAKDTYNDSKETVNDLYEYSREKVKDKYIESKEKANDLYEDSKEKAKDKYND